MHDVVATSTCSMLLVYAVGYMHCMHVCHFQACPDALLSLSPDSIASKVHNDGHYIDNEDEEVQNVEEPSQVGPSVEHHSQCNHL